MAPVRRSIRRTSLASRACAGDFGEAPLAVPRIHPARITAEQRRPGEHEQHGEPTTRREAGGEKAAFGQRDDVVEGAIRRDRAAAPREAHGVAVLFHFEHLHRFPPAVLHHEQLERSIGALREIDPVRAERLRWRSVAVGRAPGPGTDRVVARKQRRVLARFEVEDREAARVRAGAAILAHDHVPAIRQQREILRILEAA
jgi:hypothetical protein